MNRRSFISSLLASGALSGAGGLSPFIARAMAAEFPLSNQPFLASILLSGGPDFRHLMPPAFDTNEQSTGFQYWKANAASHALGDDTAALQARWQNDYSHAGDGQTSFGILQSCGWLKKMWDRGNVAIVNNVLGTSTRNHPVGVLISELGNRQADANGVKPPGWGGLLADTSQRNVLSLTASPRDFCYGMPVDVAHHRSKKRLINLSDTRSVSLYENSEADSLTTHRAEITRSVSSYYAAKTEAFAANTNTTRFADHVSKLRQFGGAIDERLAGIPVPQSIRNLYDAQLPALFAPHFGMQIRNLYDSFACADLLNMGIAALEYTGWDSHRIQKETIEPRFNDLFGEQQALDSLFSELPASVSDNLVIALGGEFGRQIVANGDGGTDHGEGMTMLLIGQPVNGGVYGEMFPEQELATLNDPGPQIKGQSGIERVYAEMADWFSPGSGAALFPNKNAAPLEPGLNLANLFI